MRSFLRKIKKVGKIASHRPRGWKSLLFNTAMAMAKKTGPLMRPVHVSIEPTNTCNARCPVCETGKGEMTRPVGMLDFANYRKLIDKIYPTTSTLLFYFMGEPFLNRHAYDMIRYALAIFLSAFLLFQVQPLTGKYILPWFGGTPAVWTTCMLFFQVLLLAGYAYAHLIAGRLRPRVQTLVHVVLLACAMAALPIVPSSSWKPTPTGWRGGNATRTATSRAPPRPGS